MVESWLRLFLYLLGTASILLAAILQHEKMGGDRSSHDIISIAIVPKVGGVLSLIACTFIMRDILIKWAGKKSVPLTSVIIFWISVAGNLGLLCSGF